MKHLWVVLALGVAVSAQTQSTRRLSEISGNTVQQKITNAKTLCATEAPTTCNIILDKEIPKVTGDTIPQDCSNCNFIDERIPHDCGTGPAGAQGPAGSDGAQGPQGIQGPKGDAGSQGIQGPAGAGGPQGIQGIPGTTGSQGPAGNDGATGPQGPKGDTGSQGPAGADGAQGTQGPAGNGGTVSYLAADTSGSASNTLGNTGMSFSIAANTKYALECNIIFTVSTTSSVGLTLGVSGPGTPTEVSLMRFMNTSATAFRVDSSQGTSWGAKVGATATTVTALSMAHLTGLIENGATAGTLNVQFANIGTTGTTVIKRGSFCRLQ